MLIINGAGLILFHVCLYLEKKWLLITFHVEKCIQNPMHMCSPIIKAVSKVSMIIWMREKPLNGLYWQHIAAEHFNWLVVSIWNRSVGNACHLCSLHRIPPKTEMIFHMKWVNSCTNEFQIRASLAIFLKRKEALRLRTWYFGIESIFFNSFADEIPFDFDSTCRWIVHF